MFTRFLALLAVLLYVTGCSLGVPLIDNVVASTNVHEGGGDGDGDGDGKRPNAGPGNSCEGAGCEGEDGDEDPGNSGDHNNAPDQVPGKGGRHDD